jgi:hypothetical protein
VTREVVALGEPAAPVILDPAYCPPCVLTDPDLQGSRRYIEPDQLDVRRQASDMHASSKVRGKKTRAYVQEHCKSERVLEARPTFYRCEEWTTVTSKIMTRHQEKSFRAGSRN